MLSSQFVHVRLLRVLLIKINQSIFVYVFVNSITQKFGRNFLGDSIRDRDKAIKFWASSLTGQIPRELILYPMCILINMVWRKTTKFGTLSHHERRRLLGIDCRLPYTDSGSKRSPCWDCDGYVRSKECPSSKQRIESWGTSATQSTPVFFYSIRIVYFG